MYLFDSPVVEHIHLQANPDHLAADANEYDLINIHGICGRVSIDRKIPTSFKSQTSWLLWLTLALRSEGIRKIFWYLTPLTPLNRVLR